MISYLFSTLADTISFDESLIFVALEIGSRSSKLDREREKERERERDGGQLSGHSDLVGTGRD